MSFNVVFEFLKVYWREILVGSLTILSFILCLIRKKPLGNVYTLIFDACLLGIKIAEKSSLKGLEKRNLVVDFVHDYLHDSYPTLNVSSYDDQIIKVIESILSTPQKKED